MANPGKPEPTEKTPKGFEVRVPKRREFFSYLTKIAKGSATGNGKQ